MLRSDSQPKLAAPPRLQPGFFLAGWVTAGDDRWPRGSDPPGRPACRPQLPHRVVAEDRREQGTDRRQVGELLGRRRRDARRDQAAGHLLAPPGPTCPPRTTGPRHPHRSGLVHLVCPPDLKPPHDRGSLPWSDEGNDPRSAVACWPARPPAARRRSGSRTRWPCSEGGDHAVGRAALVRGDGVHHLGPVRGANKPGPEAVEGDNEREHPVRKSIGRNSRKKKISAVSSALPTVIALAPSECQYLVLKFEYANSTRA